MKKDYTYCIGACEPICNRCKRHVPPTEASTPEQVYWMQPEAKNGNCPNIDFRSCGGCAHFRAQGQWYVGRSVETFGCCQYWMDRDKEKGVTSTYHSNDWVRRKRISDNACEHFQKDNQ